MSVARLAISLDKELARAVRRAAGRQATSAWLADAARRKLRAEGLLSVVRDWEQQHGELRPDELASVARAERGRSRRSR
jgi:hypothetical protein